MKTQIWRRARLLFVMIRQNEDKRNRTYSIRLSDNSHCKNDDYLEETIIDNDETFSIFKVGCLRLHVHRIPYKKKHLYFELEVTYSLYFLVK